MSQQRQRPVPSPISSCFSPSTRDRGREYVQQRRVQILRQEADQLVARVRGTSRYEVVLRLDSKTLVGTCTCRYFDGGSACKHLWATLLEADRVGFLTKGMQFDLDWDALNVDLDDEEAFEDEQLLSRA